MKKIIWAALAATVLAQGAYAGETILCKIYNGNSGTHAATLVEIPVGAPATHLTLQSDRSVSGDFELSLHAYRFPAELGGKYRLSIETSAVGNSSLKGIAFNFSKDAVFMGRTGIFDTSSGTAKYVFIDYDCGLKP